MSLIVSALMPSPVADAVMMGGVPRSPKWRACRAAYLKLHPTCAACGGRDHLNVHHVHPYHVRPDLELDPTNLVTLCEDGGNCHLMLGHLKNWSSWNTNVRFDASKFLMKVTSRPKTGGDEPA